MIQENPLFRQRFLKDFGEKKKDAVADEAGDNHAPNNVDEVVDSDEDAGETDEEGESPQNERKLLIERKDDGGDSGGDEGVVGWEAVIGSVRNEGNKVSDDEWTRIVIDHTADFCGNVDCGQGDDREKCHVFLNVSRLLEEEDRGNERDDEVEV